MTQVPIAKELSTTAESPEPRATDFTRFVWIALAVVAIIQGAVIALEGSFIPSVVRPLRHALSELPLAIGHWTGKEVELDPRIFAAVGADEQILRMYTNSARDTIAVHCATWLSTTPGMPHGPELCYTTSGWKLLETRTVTLSGWPNVRVALQKYERSNERVVLAYWYQMDDRIFVDWNGARSVRRAYWGRRQWPPLTKTLLQADASDNAESSLLEIAPLIYEFNRKL